VVFPRLIQSPLRVPGAVFRREKNRIFELRIITSGGGRGKRNPHEAKALIRRGQLRWDFVFSENGSGFHSPQEAARVLAGAIDFARQAELKASLLAPAAPQH
jgi:nitrite reductase (cytochrome c-552)